MSTILIADDNPDILTLVGEALRAAGHQVVPTVNPSRVATLLEENPVDAAVLDVVMPISGLDLLKEIRAQVRWKTLPVLLLSGFGDTEDRVRGFREGADDYLAKPFEPAELVARVERLIARRQSEHGLAGNLEDFAPGDVTQNLAQGGKTGCLRFTADHQVVEVYFVQGKIAGTEVGDLRGDNALLALLGWDSGHFVFEAMEEDEVRAKASGPASELNSILLESAWLEDELRRRRPDLARENLAFRVVGPKPQELDEDFQSLPVDEVYTEIMAHPGMTVGQILDRLQDAPSRLLLTLAILMETGSLEAKKADTGPGPQAKKRSDPLGDLILACQDRGAPSTIYLLILFQPEAWKDLINLTKTIPEDQLAGERDQLLDELIMRGSGTVRLNHSAGVVVLNLKPLRGDRLQGAALLTLASGVMLWLGDSEPPAALSQYVEGLEGSGDRARGVILCRQETPEVTSLIAGQGHWKVTGRPVKTMADLADLLI